MENTPMQRRNFLLGTASAAVGGSALLGSGAFSRVESQRNVRISVAEDPDAYLGLKPLNTLNSNNYVNLDENGHLTIDVNEHDDFEPTEDAAPGKGVNSDSKTWFDSMFQICNQGKEDACVSYTAPEDLGREDAELIFYYDGDTDGDPTTSGRVDIEEDDPLPVPVGQCVTIGFRTETFDVDATIEEPLFDGEVTIIADVDGDCFETAPTPEPECVECSFDTDVATSPEVTVESTASTGFPDVSTFLDIDTPTGNNGDLTASDFSLCGDGCSQAVDVEITGENKPVDFVFQLDVTGSMGGEIDGVKAEIENFVDSVEAEGIDGRYALYLFGDDDESGNEPPAVFLKQDLTADRAEIIDAVQNTSLGEEVGTGGPIPEDNYEVIITPTCELSFRPGAEVVMIDITDAPSDEDPEQTVCGLPEVKSSAIDVLMGNIAGFPKPTYFAVSPDATGTHQKKTIADEVDGTWIELGEDFDPILSAIEAEVAGAYRVSYTTTNPATDGSARDVVVEIQDPDEGTLYAVTDYTAPV